MKTQALKPDFKMEMIDVAHKMKQEKLPAEFVAAAVQVSFELEGAYNLMKMWSDETDPEEKDEIVADLQGLIDDYNEKGQDEGVYVRFDDLDQIAKDIRGFKDSLRGIVDNNGGIGKLAELTGIPQPSLSRFFSTASMPRRATLLRIAKALKLSEVEIATEWAR